MNVGFLCVALDEKCDFLHFKMTSFRTVFLYNQIKSNSELWLDRIEAEKMGSFEFTISFFLSHQIVLME